MPPLLVCLLTLLLAAATRPWSVTAAAAAKPRVFPLRARQVPAGALPRPPSKLRFHHNVSLTVSLAVGTPPQNVTMVLRHRQRALLASLQRAGRPAGKRPPGARRSGPGPRRASRPCPAAQAVAAPATCRRRRPATRRRGSCRVSLSYADGSTSDGALATDVFRVGDAPPPAVRVRVHGHSPTLPLPYFDRVAYSVQLLGIRVGGKPLPIPASVLAPDHTGAGQTM
ncbi:hypothetical protein EJB05_52655, partial [Eragrostis curvula]